MVVKMTSLINIKRLEVVPKNIEMWRISLSLFEFRKKSFTKNFHLENFPSLILIFDLSAIIGGHPNVYHRFWINWLKTHDYGLFLSCVPL